MNRKLVLFYGKMGRLSKGGTGMNAVLERPIPDKSPEKGICKTDDSKCEMAALRNFNLEIIESNGYSASEVKNIISEVCGRSIKSRSRY